MKRELGHNYNSIRYYIMIQKKALSNLVIAFKVIARGCNIQQFDSGDGVTFERFLLTSGPIEATWVRIGSETEACDEAIATFSTHSTRSYACNERPA